MCQIRSAPAVNRTHQVGSVTFDKVSYFGCVSVDVVIRGVAMGAGGLGFCTRAGQIDVMLPTARHRFDVSF